LRFGAEGLAHNPAAGANAPPYGSLVADICTSSITSNNHRQISMTAGSILAVTTTSGACP
jgi:type IV fimbrial biogenesis protein FimT